MKKENREFDFGSSNIILYLWQWRKVFIIVGTAAVVLSAVFSAPWFITPKYKSTVIMFPTSTNSISKSLIATNVSGRQDVLEFGEETQAEQMLQILNSSKIKEQVIEMYDLANHYEIDENSKYRQTRLYREFDSNISFRRTEYMAVQITVLDKDPQIAADIANTISDLFDTVKNEMQRERAMEAFAIVEDEYNNLLAEMKWKEDSLEALRKFGIFDYELQVESYSELYATALSKGSMQGANAIKKELDKLAEYGGTYHSIKEGLVNDRKHFVQLNEKYKEAKIDAEKSLPHKFIVDRAYKAEKKSYPIRWLIVVVSTFASLILATLAVISYDTLLASNDILKKKKEDKSAGK